LNQPGDGLRRLGIRVGRNWRGGETDCAVDFVERIAAGVFNNQTGGCGAMKEDSAGVGLKLEKIGAAEKFLAIRVF
jgi:hypothetical protein